MLGAFKELAQQLSASNIGVLQHVRQDADDGTLAKVITYAKAIYYDADYTHYDRLSAVRIETLASQACYAVDSSRLVPLCALPRALKTTPDFRKAHGTLRDTYAAYHSPEKDVPKMKETPIPLKNFASYSEAELHDIVQSIDFTNDIAIAENHPPTSDEIQLRVTRLTEHILGKYKWIRNNPALDYSTSELSPYLHFGMVSPFELWNVIDNSDVPKSYTWKFRDEAFTWREWAHYQAFHNDRLHYYDALPDVALHTLEDHKGDPRPELISVDDIIAGNTKDNVFNAAIREWVNTGWLHNNLRMYLAKQILRFTPSLEAAWNLACSINDLYSLDGRDPATYTSMRWAFGDACKGYSERPIYGWIAPKSDNAILKRDGMSEWISERIN